MSRLRKHLNHRWTGVPPVVSANSGTGVPSVLFPGMVERTGGTPVPLLSPSRILKNVSRLLLLAFLFGVFSPAPSARAEGSKEINNNGFDRAYLEYRQDNTAGSSVPRKTIIYAYAKSGETISLGSSACGVGLGTIEAGTLGGIIWYAPDGTIGTNTSTTIGVITSITQELAGPLPNAGGYRPTNLTVGASQTGIWRIDFVSPRNVLGTDVAPGAAAPANSAAWVQPNNVQYVTAWDVTVHSGNTNTPAVLGRAFTTQIAMNMGANGRYLHSVVYFLTQDGYQYKCDLNGIDPYGFNFFANNNGFETNGVGTGASFQSTPLAVNDVQNPNAPDTATEITHKLFFNTPDSTLPVSGNSYSGSDWLLSPPVTPPTVNSVNFVGLDGTTNQLGAGLGGTFTFSSTGPGTYIIALDLNSDGVFTSAVDRVLEGAAVFGANHVFWDGKDGTGNPAPRGNGSFTEVIAVASGVVHFPFLDVEYAPSGFIITRQNGPAASRSLIFYDDSNFASGVKYLPPTGIDSSGGAHVFPTVSGGFGNNRGIDTWTMVIGSIFSNQMIQIKVADLQVVSKSISPTVVGPTSNVTYTVVLKNNGPDTVARGKFLEYFPPGLSNLTVASSLFSSNGTIVASAWSNNTYTATLSMISNETSTFTFTATPAPGLGSILTNVANFLTYNDVGDPNDPNRIGAGNNNQTNITAVTFTVSGKVYNDANFNGILDGGETGTNLSLYAKLIPTNAPSAAVQAVLVDNSGNYSLTTTNAGGYIVILDNNNTLSDVIPYLPPGWLGTQAPGQTSDGISLTASNAIGQNFGLYNGSYLVVSKSATPALVSGLSNTLFSITITNTSSISNALATIVDNLPTNIATGAGLTYSNGTSIFNGSPIGNPTIVGVTNLTWTGPFNIPGNSVATLSFRARIPATAGAYTNKAYALIGTTQIDATTNSTDNVPAQAIVLEGNYADLGVLKTGPATISATNQFAYSITVSNNGPAAATSLVVTDSLPVNLTFISATGGGATNASLTNVYWAVASLASGSATNLGVTVKAPSTGVITNLVVAGSTATDPNLSDNTTNWITTVIDQADVRAIKTGPVTVNATNQFAYTISVTNGGPSSAVSVVVTDSLPANLTFISATGGGVTNASLTNVFWSVASLTNGAVTNLSLTVKAPTTGIISNTLVAGSTTGDPVPGNNTTNWVTTVTDQADLWAVKTGPATIPATNQFTYTILVTNGGPSTAVSVVVTDSLPANVTFISATSGGATNASLTNVYWSVASLTNGAVTNLSLTVKAPATGIISNSVVTGSPTGDPTPGNNTTNWFTTVTDQADVRAIKTGPVTVNATNQFAYTIAVTNNGPSTAVSVVVTDSLPANLTFISATGGGATNASLTNVYWSVASLTNGAITNLSLIVKAPATGQITNTLVAGSITADPTPGNNTTNWITSVSDQADLAITKTGVVTIPATNQFTYTIAVTNNGPSTAVSVVVTDSLPANLTFISATGGGATNTSLTNVYWSVASLTNGAVTNLSLTVKAPASGIISNSVVAGSTTGDPTPGNNSFGPFITTVTDQADLAITKTGVTTIPATNQFAYTIAVTNDGPSTAVSVVVTDSLPANLTFISATGGGATNASLTNVYWSVASLTNGAVTNLSLTVKAPASGIISNSVVAGSTTGDPTPGNNSFGPFITTVTDQADLAVTKTGVTTIPATNQFTYTIAVTNNGPSSAVSVVVTDSLPANLTFISATGGGATNASLTNVYWSVASLTNGAVTNLSLTVKAPATGIISNHVVTGSPTGDPTPGNNSFGPFITTVTDQADLAITKTGAVTIPATNQFTYTIAVTNNGPSTAVSVVVTDSLPANLTFISATGGGATNVSLTNVFWSVASLTNGAVTNLSLTVKAPASGIVSNFVATGSSTGDPTPGNNSAGPFITTVTPIADLAITKTGATSWPANSNLVYTITLTNIGPSAATSVVVTDSLPAAATFVGASASGAHSGNFVAWGPIATFAAGATSNFTVTVTTPSAGVLTNTSSGGAATSDPNSSNNDGTAAGAKVITTLAGGVTVSGFVYNDVNRNSTKDSGENGTGQALYAKLFNGTVTNVVSVNTGTGAGTGGYAFSNAPPGTYTIVVSTNNSLTDVTATLPAGWVGTEISNQIRANVAVASADVPNQNFGLYNGARLSGVVFADTGASGGTPNDGVRNGGESGIAGATVKLTDNAGSTLYDTTTTDGGGKYTLFVPASAGTVKVVETNLTGYVSTGASVGNTAGTYDRPSDTITFANVAGTTYTNVSFGDVPVNQFMPDNQQTALPGSVVFYAHTFIAGSGGQVTFTVTNLPNPNIPGWTSTVYVDSNCNGKYDANEPLLTNTVTVVAGQQLCILVKEFVPAGATQNAQDIANVTANFSYTNAAPVLVAAAVHSDVTTVGNPTTAGLTLVKAVDKATAFPGEILNYTLVYQNTSSGNLTNIVISDTTPAYSTFVNATAGALPPNLTGVTITAPTSNTVGAINWQFNGLLAPGNSGTVGFGVQVAP